MRRILSAVFALLCAASASAAPFQNGSFELGTLPADPCNDALTPFSTAIAGWTVNAGDINYLTGSPPFTCWQPAEGDRSLDLIGNGSVGGGITQTFDTVPGQTYQVIFDMSGNPGPTFLPSLKSMTVTVNGVPHNYAFETSSSLTTVQPTNMQWIQYSFFFTASGTSSTISFLDTSGSSFAGAALDNVRVQPVAGANVIPWIDDTPVGNVHAGQSATFPVAPQVCGGPGNTWNATDTRTFPLTVSSDGTNGTFVASYNVPATNLGTGVCGSWTTTATAPPTFNGDVVVLWDYRGDHSSFDTTVDLQAFLIPGPLSTSTPFNIYITSGSNNGTKFQYNGQFTFTVQPGDTYGFKMTGSNFDFADALRGTLTGVVMEQPAAATLATPVLIRALPSGSAVIPLLIGRVDDAPNVPITVQLYSGTTCTNGVLGGTITQIGSDASVTTDPANPATLYPGGYFGTLQGGAQGQFVAIKVTSPTVTPLSNCLVTAADNDTWPKALRLTGDSVNVPDWIDFSGKARWYRFSILPGQSIQVNLSGLPADYDLAVFKDIYAEFVNELAPENTLQLTKLTAQYAPSAFSPSAFSPSAFSPSAFSPSAFSPSAFSPSAFSPSAFSPSAFSPSAFSPSAFSPSAFSPSAFSPSAFSPSAFSPSAFSPSAFSPSAFSSDELAQAFSSAQTRSILATSMTPGLANEFVIVNTWNNTGDFYVRVTGRSGAFSTSPYNLAVTKQGASCAPVSDTVISNRTAIPGSYNTIVLVDSSRTSLTAAVPGGTLGGKLTSFVQRADVNGVIVDVATDSRIGVLKTQATNNLLCPFAKNLVALEIKSIIDAYMRGGNPLRYVVIIGNDAAIPFFRYPDNTNLGPESGYVPPVASNSASDASLRGNFILTQDPYGAATTISLRVSEFPIPGGAVGRLVETPAEIAGMIDAYVAANGSVTPSSSLVTGYDFLADAATAVKTELECGTGFSNDSVCGPNANSVPGTVSHSLITPNTVSPADTDPYPAGPWKASDLSSILLVGPRHDVMFLGGHFNANSALAADFTTSIVTSDLTSSAVNLTNSLVFSAGCHAGYNIVDTDAITGVTFPLDWAQAAAQKKMTLVAGTGYQYGDTEFLEYSERLYLNFAKELRAGTGDVAIGEALVKAKRAYLAATSDIRGLHEKAVLEATVFGLPMLRVNMPAGRIPVSASNGVIDPDPPAVPGPATTLGLQLADVSVPTTLTPHTLTLKNYDIPPTPDVIATWLSGPDGVVTNPAEPALPLQIKNVTPIDFGGSALVLRGVGFRGAAYSDSQVFPLTGAPTTELRGVHLAFASPVFYPMRLWTTNYFSALSGGNGTSLLVTPAQHRALNATDSTLRQYSNLDLRLFYTDFNALDAAHAPAVLSDAPTIVRVGAVPNTISTTLFAAQVVGDPAAAIYQVWVTFTDGAIPVPGSGSWASIDLQQCVEPLPAACGTTADSQFWMAVVPNGGLPADTRYIAQAVSGTGLVTLDDNLGRYYSYAVAAAAPVASAITFTPPVPTTAVYGSSVSVTAVLSAASSVTGKLVTFAAGGAAKTGTTDGSGSVTVSLPVLSLPGSYALSASFGGDGTLLPSAATAALPITVTKAPTTLAPPALPLTGAGAVLTATNTGQPLIQETVQFLVSGPQGAQLMLATTDYNGFAAIPAPGSPPGAYSVIQACFGGNATYSDTKLNASAPCPNLFSGFFAPISNPPALNTVKAGQSVPVKFSLGGNHGLNIFSTGSPSSQQVDCTTLAPLAAPVVAGTSGGSTLAYNSTTDQYTYSWKSDKGWANTCRVLIIKFNDGSSNSERRANFQFTK